MTFRDRLADWISGGALTRAKRDADFYSVNADRIVSSALKYIEVLERIAAMETPNANATVRRMAKTAREALK